MTDNHEDLYAALEDAKRYYHGLLMHAPEAESARAFLLARGIERQAWEDLCLGFAPPEWDHYLRRARSSGISMWLLAAAGILHRRANGRRFYDHFRARLMFPIADEQGRTVGFSARILGKGTPLYVNTPQTALFDKSKVSHVLSKIRTVLGDDPEKGR